MVDRIPIQEQVRVKRLPYALPSKLREILDGFKWAMLKKNQSAVMVVDGRSGMGKTTLSLQCATYMTESFNIDNIHYTPEEFIESLRHTKKGDVIVFDEAMLLSSRAALTKINRMMVVAMSMIRSKNIFIIFNVNSIFDLDKNLALSRADLLLHVYGESLTSRGTFLAFFKGGDGRDRIKELYLHGKKYYSYSTPKSNFNSNFGKYFTVDEVEYEVRKQKGVDAFLLGTKKEKTTKDKRQKMALAREMNENGGYTQTQIAEILGIKDQGTVSNMIRRLNAIEEEEKESKGSLL